VLALVVPVGLLIRFFGVRGGFAVVSGLVRVLGGFTLSAVAGGFRQLL
jgi:hypothetical protein